MKVKYRFVFVWLFLTLSLFAGCRGQQEKMLFEKMPPGHTRVDFSNEITSSDSLNIQNYPFMYNGGGVAIGDINNDGLSDLFFTGNMVSCRLYLNKGNMRFEDITESAGVETDRWASGVSMADLNADGYLDIYVSAVSRSEADPEERANLLFINNGDTTFTESAADYNIDYAGFTTHSAFLDYDRDGDLDLFLLNHSPDSFARNEPVRRPSPLFGQTATSFDELFRNNGEGSFTRVTRQAGLVREEGFGLGVAVSDFNRDGWPDIYVSNDILPDDELYINNRDGTFTDRADEFLKHTSFAGMGIDVADFNNDGWPDLFQADMMPKQYKERKLMSGGISYEHYQAMRQRGFYYQYSINTLQLSNGLTGNGEVIFSEIGRMAGVAYTNWSWSALFGDYDNDGRKDLMITNGFPKAINNYDYLTRMNNEMQFGTPEARRERKLEILENLRSIKIPNYVFRNNGDLTFSDKSDDWNVAGSGYSYGASQADLDNDGDLDIVISNINATASVYRNRADTLTGHRYLSVSLQGSALNRNGIGAEVILSTGSKRQYQYASPYRGYQSSTDPRIHFGIGDNDRIDSLEVIWPDGSYQVLRNVAAGRQLTLRYENAVKSIGPRTPWRTIPEERPFTEITATLGTKYRHRENSYVDYSVQGLLPYQLSKLGPRLASADLNGDGMDEFYIGGPSGHPGTLFVPSDDGTYERAGEGGPWISESEYEDMDAVFFDADGDGDEDLYVASGGYEFSPASELLQDRLYINTGDGTFVRDESALPRMLTSSSCVKPADYDGDGDLDLFVGGRMVPRRYPYPANSYLLRNDGGTFVDVTSDIAPELVEPGMITDAEWSDFNGDGHPDLVTVGEWLPVQFYENRDGSFSEVTGSMGLSSLRGWWFSLEQGDFDNDGDSDFVAGNMGLNYGYVADEQQKFEVFASDFDKNQSLDLLFSVRKNGTHYPYYGKAKLGLNIPAVNKKFVSYQQFAESTVPEVVGESGVGEALHLQVDTFASSYLENRGTEGFKVVPLPNEAQISAVNDLVSMDVNRDGNLDLVLAGNMYHTEPQTARNDAGNGVLLLGDGEGNFEPVSPFESGFLVPGQVSDLELVYTATGSVLLAAQNSDSLQAFGINR